MISDKAPATTGQALGRPRDSTIDRRIVEAAIEQYAETGWSRFSFETVAARAGIGKSALYLRYKSREELLTSAFDQMMYADIEIDTGTFRGDLREMISWFFTFRFSVIGGLLVFSAISDGTQS